MPTEENQRYINENAIKNKLATINYTECENLLRNHYKIPHLIPLLMRNIQLDANTILKNLNDYTASDIVNIKIFHPETFEKLDLEICKNVSNKVNIPIKDEKNYNLHYYKKIKSKFKGVIDIYDANSIGFNTKCISVLDPDTGSDTTVNSRISNMYQNQTIRCVSGCEYSGIDENNYVICECLGISDDEDNIDSGISNNSTFDILIRFPEFNYDIFLCYEETFNDVV